MCFILVDGDVVIVCVVIVKFILGFVGVDFVNVVNEVVFFVVCEGI